ncbi:hypothetical protein [Micromonospora sp. NPDC048169]|uniref:hypothetical protein n=1 Tax=Micromonospora sp. NPDC048169 TaxID=3154711 RepID=UPI0033D5DC4D
MTTTEPAQHVSPPNDFNVTDPEYIAAFLKQALVEARAHADGEEPEWRYPAHVGFLAGRVNDFADSLRAHSPAGIAFARELWERTGLHWTRASRFLATADSIEGAEELARSMGLTEATATITSRSWDGEVDGWPVTVFADTEGPE